MAIATVSIAVFQCSASAQSVQFGTPLPPPPNSMPPPPPPSREGSALEHYLVYVRGGRPGLLSQVRQVEPDAFVRTYNGESVIQAGVFLEERFARSRVQALEARGINARLGRIDLNGGIPSLVSAGSEKGYFTIIPGDRAELNRIASQIRPLVSPGVEVSIRDEPYGPHVAIGPFERRSRARSLSRQLQQAGFGRSRVHYGR